MTYLTYLCRSRPTEARIMYYRGRLAVKWQSNSTIAVGLITAFSAFNARQRLSVPTQIAILLRQIGLSVRHTLVLHRHECNKSRVKIGGVGEGGWTPTGKQPTHCKHRIKKLGGRVSTPLALIPVNPHIEIPSSITCLT